MKERKKYSSRRTALFLPAVRTHVFQDVAGQLEEAIMSGRLPSGQRLPGVEELMRRFQTSRQSIREALRILEEKGLITIGVDKKNDVVVNAIQAPKTIFDFDRLIRSDKLSLDCIAEFRETFEGHVAASAAAKADAADIRHLHALTIAGRRQIGRGSAAFWDFIEADKNVHLALAKISGNPFYTHLIETTHDIKSYFERYRDLGNKSWEVNFADLMAIVDAVGKHKSELAENLSRQHVRHFKDL